MQGCNTLRQTIIDECLVQIPNRFELVKAISSRAKQLARGSKPLVDLKGEKKILLSMREIADGKVFLTNETNNDDK